MAALRSKTPLSLRSWALGTEARSPKRMSSAFSDMDEVTRPSYHFRAGMAKNGSPQKRWTRIPPRDYFAARFIDA